MSGKLATKRSSQSVLSRAVKNVKNRNFIKIHANESDDVKNDVKTKVFQHSDDDLRGVVYLSHIPNGFHENEMRQYFNQFGHVTRLKLARSEKTGRSKGYAFIEFRYSEVAKVVAETMNNYLMSNRLIKAQYLDKKFPNKFWKRQVTPNTCFKAMNRRKDIQNKNALKLPLQRMKQNQKGEKKLKVLLEKLKAQGVDYDFKATATSQIKQRPVLEVDESDDEIDFQTPPNVIKRKMKSEEGTSPSDTPQAKKQRKSPVVKKKTLPGSTLKVKAAKRLQSPTKGSIKVKKLSAKTKGVVQSSLKVKKVKDNPSPVKENKVKGAQSPSKVAVKVKKVKNVQSPSQAGTVKKIKTTHSPTKMVKVKKVKGVKVKKVKTVHLPNKMVVKVKKGLPVIKIKKMKGASPSKIVAKVKKVKNNNSPSKAPLKVKKVKSGSIISRDALKVKKLKRVHSPSKDGLKVKKAKLVPSNTLKVKKVEGKQSPSKVVKLKKDKLNSPKGNTSLKKSPKKDSPSPFKFSFKEHVKNPKPSAKKGEKGAIKSVKGEKVKALQKAKKVVTKAPKGAKTAGKKVIKSKVPKKVTSKKVIKTKFFPNMAGVKLPIKKKGTK